MSDDVKLQRRMNLRQKSNCLGPMGVIPWECWAALICTGEDQSSTPKGAGQPWDSMNLKGGSNESPTAQVGWMSWSTKRKLFPFCDDPRLDTLPPSFSSGPIGIKVKEIGAYYSKLLRSFQSPDPHKEEEKRSEKQQASSEGTRKQAESG